MIADLLEAGRVATTRCTRAVLVRLAVLIAGITLTAAAAGCQSTLSAVRQGAEMSQASAEQRSIAGTVPCALRPPYGEYDATTLRLAQQQRMSVWLWTIDTLDWAANGSGSSYWVQRIIRLAEQGDTVAHPILLMHDARPGDPATVAALPTVIQYYRARDYRFVAL